MSCGFSSYFTKTRERTLQSSQINPQGAVSAVLQIMFLDYCFFLEICIFFCPFRSPKNTGEGREGVNFGRAVPPVAKAFG